MATVTFGSGSAGDAAPEPEEPPVDPEDGDNRILNSKLAGDNSTSATNWTVTKNGSGAVTFASGAVAEHRDVRSVAVGVDYNGVAFIEQDYDIVEGTTYILSGYVVAVTDAGPVDNEHVVINHSPFSALAVDEATPRPVLSNVSPGERVWYRATATQTRSVRLIMGLDRDGDITMNRPMIEEASTLGGYVATDPVTPPDPPEGINNDAAPWRNLYEGLPIFAQQNISKRLGSNTSGSWVRTPMGFRFRSPRSGTIKAFQSQHATNRSDFAESTKSVLAGVTPHSFPYVGKLQYEIFRGSYDAGADRFVASGSAIYSVQYTITQNAPSVNESRYMLTTAELTISVDEGEWLGIKWTPELANTHGSINVAGIPNGPQRPSPLSGGPFTETHFNCGAWSSNILSNINGMINGVAAVYSDGVVEGYIGLDATASGLTEDVGGANWVRQTYTGANYWRRASAFGLCMYKGSGTSNNVEALIYVDGVLARTVTFPSSDFPTSSEPLRWAQRNLSSPLDLPPSTPITILVRSTTSASNGYRIPGTRDITQGGSPTATIQSPAPYTTALLNRHSWSRAAEQSNNSGSSWFVAGYPSGLADLPVALYTGQNVATTQGGLA